MTRSTEEINAEKSAKPPVERVPPDIMILAAKSIGYGIHKHGLDESGQGTYVVEGSEQARVGTHIRSMVGHLFAALSGQHADLDVPPEFQIMHWNAFFAQASIVARLLNRPVGEVHEHDRRYYPEGWLP